MFDDSTARHLDSATSASVAEDTAVSSGGPTLAHSAPTPQPDQAPDEKPAAAASDDFAAALETFTTESEEAISEDHVLTGTVLKLTPTHVVVDIGAKSEGMLPLSEVSGSRG